MKTYTTPEITPIGSVSDITAARGTATRDDQSDFPDAIPPATGSIDVLECNNNTPGQVC